jgi:hypothetical protein
MALVRSMTHGGHDHEIPIYRSLTGHVDPGVAVPNHARQRTHFPGVGGAGTYGDTLRISLPIF